MKLGLLAAGLVLVAGGAVGCGGDGGGGDGHGAPSAKEFCGELEDFHTAYANSDPTGDLKGYIRTIKQSAARLGDLGTPDSMPSDAKAGFALTVQRIKALPDDATVDQLAQIGDVSDADQKKLDALDDYIGTTCPDLGGQTNSPSSSPSSSPS
jgi:hypothetical protein